MWFPRRFLGSGCVFVEAERCLHAQPRLTPVCWQEKARGRGALFAQLLHYDVLINNQKMNNTPRATAVSVAKLCLSCLPQPQAVMEQMLLAAGREFPVPPRSHLTSSTVQLRLWAGEEQPTVPWMPRAHPGPGSSSVGWRQLCWAAATPQHSSCGCCVCSSVSSVRGSPKE